jgi:hypothetical protein
MEGLPPPELKAAIKAYVSQLEEDEKKVLAIAQEHLGTSFDMAKSIGFLEWHKKNKAIY